jgi:HK97 family phage major capsid protein
MNMSELIESLQRDLAAAQERKRRAKAEAEAILDGAKAAGRANLTAEEDKRCETLFSAVDAAKADERSLESKLARAREAQAEDDAADAKARESHPTGAGLPGGSSTHTLSGSVVHNRATDSQPWVRSSDGRPAAVERSQAFASHPVVADEIARNRGRDEHTIATFGGLGQMIRSLSTTSGSSLVPTIWASNIIDRARNAAQVVAAGAEFVPMDSKVLQIGRLTADPTTIWHTEGGTITASDPTFDNVQLVAKTLSCLTVASLEFLQDAKNADQVVEAAIGQAMGLAIDDAALFGGVTAGGEGINQPSPPSPLGILANLLANASSSVLGSGANGTTITVATPWNELLDTYYTPQQNNETPTAILMNAKMAQKYAKTYDTLGQPLRRPPVLDNTPILTTNQIPSFTQGTMTNIATDIFCGDFRQVLIGNRMDVTVQVLTERYAELGQVGILSTWRGDIALARPRAMCVYRYIGGS